MHGPQPTGPASATTVGATPALVAAVGAALEPGRILHIHENKPGIMREINRVVSEHDVNIEGQFLRTLPALGYVVIDLNSSEETSQSLLHQLKAIDGTLRSRILF